MNNFDYINNYMILKIYAKFIKSIENLLKKLNIKYLILMIII